MLTATYFILKKKKGITLSALNIDYVIKRILKNQYAFYQKRRGKSYRGEFLYKVHTK